ncbi:MAG: hypothetical protein M3442_06705 [Chloroflexota bacterium]|nr:hypothetical protein [Chloroflexota bacterium]
MATEQRSDAAPQCAVPPLLGYLPPLNEQRDHSFHGPRVLKVVLALAKGELLVHRPRLPCLDVAQLEDAVRPPGR